jgi:hypothetical protein
MLAFAVSPLSCSQEASTPAAGAAGLGPEGGDASQADSAGEAGLGQGGAALDGAVGEAGAGGGGAGGSAGSLAGGAAGQAAAAGAAGSPSAERGYFTTAQELAAVAKRAASNDEPYKKAVEALKKLEPEPTAWSWGTLDGEVACGGPDGGDPGVPAYIANSGGGPSVLAKAYLYHLTGQEAYAADARVRLLELVDTTGWGGEVYSGANQCILNLSWFVPRFIQAAELLEGYSGWSAQDKQQLQQWLATEVYKKTSWCSGARMNNWGSAGSLTSAMIADYLAGGAVQSVKERDGTVRTLHEAWVLHTDNQLARMNGTKKMDSQCEIWGIQTHGGIPDELRRGSSGCTATWIHEQDASFGYQLAHVQSLVAHAEMLWRRGSTVLFDNVAADGKGSLLQSMLFVLDNPTQSWPWTPSQLPTLEISYKYYRDVRLCEQLKCSSLQERVITGKGTRVMSFATLTHGFGPQEDPGPPPAVAPP